MTNVEQFITVYIGLRPSPVQPAEACHRHDTRPAVIAAVTEEDSMGSERTAYCQECMEKMQADLRRTFYNPSRSGTSICDSCGVDKPRFVQLLRKDHVRDVVEEFRNYRDIEDGSFQQLCRPCYLARSKSDAEYWAE